MFRGVGLRKTVEQPVLDLNFAAAGALDSRITFSRGTSATFVGSNGLIQTAGNNVARFDHDPATNTPRGLMIEEARTNIAPNSHEFNAAAGVTRSADAHTAPDGATTADEFTISSSNQSHQITNVGLAASDVTIGTVHAVSFFVKLINGTPNIGVRGFGKGGFNTFPIFDLNAGTVVNVGSGWESGTAIESFGNGWFRCKCVVNPSSQFAPLIHLLASGDTTGTGTFTGNGTDKVAVWGGQLEVGSFVTSHIATTGSTATRNADVATMGPTNSKPFEEYNPAEGTVLFEASVPAGMASYSSFFNITDDGVFTDRVSIINNDTNSQIYTQVRTGGSTLLNTFSNSVSYTLGQNFRVALAYAASDFASTVDASTVRTATSGAVPAMDSIKIGIDANNATPGCFHARRVRIFSNRLPDSILQSLTSD